MFLQLFSHSVPEKAENSWSALERFEPCARGLIVATVGSTELWQPPFLVTEYSLTLYGEVSQYS